MLLFLVYLFIETIVSVQFASMLGGFGTFIEILFSAFVGIILLKNVHIGLHESLTALKERDISYDEFERLNLLSVLGAVLLIIPGFFSDIVGILFQFDFFSLIFIRKFFKSNKNREDRRDDEIIDVEIIDSNSK